VRDLTFAVPCSMVRQWAFRYDLDACRCRWSDCSSGAFAAGRYGVPNSLPVGGGFNLRRGGAAGDAFKPYLGFAFANAHGASGELQVERGGPRVRAVPRQLALRLAGVGAAGPVVLDRRGFGLGGGAAQVLERGRVGHLPHRRGGISAVRLSGHVDGHLGAGMERWSATGALYHAGGRWRPA
jgi:hypothetical protein